MKPKGGPNKRDLKTRDKKVTKDHKNDSLSDFDLEKVISKSGTMHSQ